MILKQIPRNNYIVILLFLLLMLQKINQPKHIANNLREAPAMQAQTPFLFLRYVFNEFALENHVFQSAKAVFPFSLLNQTCAPFETPRWRHGCLDVFMLKGLCA